MLRYNHDRWKFENDEFWNYLADQYVDQFGKRVLTAAGIKNRIIKKVDEVLSIRQIVKRIIARLLFVEIFLVSASMIASLVLWFLVLQHLSICILFSS